MGSGQCVFGLVLMFLNVGLKRFPVRLRQGTGYHSYIFLEVVDKL